MKMKAKGLPGEIEVIAIGSEVAGDPSMLIQEELDITSSEKCNKPEKCDDSELINLYIKNMNDSLEVATKYLEIARDCANKILKSIKCEDND